MYKRSKVHIYLELTRLLVVALIATILLPGSLPAQAQDQAGSFAETFQVFQRSANAARTFDLSVDEMVYALPPTYRLGPGDIIQVILTGMISDVLQVQVGPQGDVFIPPAGLLKIEGMTVGEAKEYINGELKRYLINYELALQLLRARKMTVYLLGEVRQPGTYMGIAGTSAITLIQTAGSLVTNPITVNPDETEYAHPYFRALTSGAGRWLQVWRNNELARSIDLAQVAVGGNAADDIVLEDGDALYVPPNAEPVVVRGGVARPGTYEVKSGDTVLDLLAQAGGYRSMLMLGEVQIERRTIPGISQDTSLITLNLGDPNFDPQSFTLQAGDMLRVPEAKNQVYVLGAVWMPQSIDFHEGWTALDYIAEAGGPTAPGDTAGIRIISFPLTEDQTELRFVFKNLLLGGPVESVPIEPGDLIYVPWKNQPFYGTGVTNVIANMLGQTVGLLRLIHDTQ
jgi:protein involved in polysaccharide export with SLBB domain